MTASKKMKYMEKKLFDFRTLPTSFNFGALRQNVLCNTRKKSLTSETLTFLSILEEQRMTGRVTY